MTATNAGPAFAQWLRAELKATGMSRRHLAHLSGVDHSTISRLVLGQRMPSLETAASLARVLPALDEHPLPIPGLHAETSRAISAPARVEYALRRDESLSADDVRAIMAFYLQVRSGTGTATPTVFRRRPPVAVHRSPAGVQARASSSPYSRPAQELSASARRGATEASDFDRLTSGPRMP